MLIIDNMEKALFTAIVNSDFLKLDELIVNININQRTFLGMPIEIATRNGKLDVVKYFVLRGANPISGLLNMAVSSGSIELIEYIYNQNFDRDVNNCVSLLTSTKYDDKRKVEIMNKLIDLGADANLYLDDACVLNNEVTKALINRGANPLTLTNGMTVIEFALRRGVWHPLYYSLLPDKSNEIYVAIFNKDLNKVKELCDNGLNVNTFNNTLSLNPPLLVAIETSALDIASYLIDFGADIHYLTPNGIGLSVLAVNTNILSTVQYVCNLYLSNKLLLDTEYKSLWGSSTPLRDAISNQNVEIVRLLLLFGANPNKTYGPNKETVGYTIACVYNAQILRMLMNFGLDVNYQAKGMSSIRNYMMYNKNLPDPLLLKK
jgi:ankyrin repeat protein